MESECSSARAEALQARGLKASAEQVSNAIECVKAAEQKQATAEAGLREAVQQLTARERELSASQSNERALLQDNTTLQDTVRMLQDKEESATKTVLALEDNCKTMGRQVRQHVLVLVCCGRLVVFPMPHCC